MNTAYRGRFGALNSMCIGRYLRNYCVTTLLLLVTVLSTSAWALSTVRGPYLQSGTPNSIIVRWRTDSSSDSVVRYGTTLGNLDQATSNSQSTRNHEIKLTSLAPETTYYYSVGSSSQVLSGNDSDHFFVTSPPNGSSRPTRVWVLGDSGTANGNARSVRDAYLDLAAPADLMMMLGDNAYDDGTDAEYQDAVFDMYPTILRNTVLWSTLGNHDGHSADSNSQSGPYYDIFSFPRAGEAGGLASGTEAYYSFDHANIHFVCLDSYETNRSPSGAMLSWLEQDLAATTQDWIIAYWHHPPYSKGSHDSDSEGRLIDMRENVLPILEDYGVDLVLSGHSHSYERSYLLDGHYRSSNSLTNAMILDGGDGREDGDGAYVKSAGAPHDGAVYVVAGSSGQRSGGSLNHPAMYLSLNQLGSLVMDIDGDRLDVTFLRENSSTPDHFTILKGADTTPPRPISALALGSTRVQIQFSEALDETTANNATNYQVDGGVSVSAAALQPDGRTVELTTSTLSLGLVYTATITDVEDLAENAVTTPDNTIVFEWLNMASLEVQVAQTSDDAEERLSNGSMYLDSSDLELVDDASYNGLQTVAMRFQDLAIPKRANIIAAHIEFETDETGSGGTALSIYGEDRGNALTFANTNYNISSRPKTTAVVGWNPPSWNLVSEKHQTPNLAAIVQEIVDRSDWSFGNNMAFVVTGSGERTAESFDGESANAPILRVDYSLTPSDEQAPTVPTGLQLESVSSDQVTLTWNASSDNVAVTSYNLYRDGAWAANSTSLSFADSSVSPATTYDYQVSAMDAAGNESNLSSALTVTTEDPPLPLPGQANNPTPTHLATDVSTDPQLSWSTGGNADSYNVYFGTDPTPDAGELQGSQVATVYTPTSLDNNVTYYWRIDAVNPVGVTQGSVWRFTTQADADTTPPIAVSAIALGSTSVQIKFSEALDKTTAENATNYQINGGVSVSAAVLQPDAITVELTASTLAGGSYVVSISNVQDLAGNPIDPGAQIPFEWLRTAALEVQVSQTSDDAEESLNNGSMYLDSSDLELVDDASYNGLQTVGMRFQDLAIPQGANIIAAHIEFETDEISTGGTALSIRGEDRGNAATFTSSNYNISARPKTTAVVDWNPRSWNLVSEKHQTPDLAAVVQEIVSRSDWSPGNNMAFVVTGSGERTAESYDGESANAPVLRVEYSIGPADEQAPSIPIGLQLASVTSDEVTMTWSASSDNIAVTGYGVYRDGTWLANNTGLSFTDSRVSPATTYDYQVSARDAAGNESSVSSTLTVTTDDAPLPTPGQPNSPTPAHRATNISTDTGLSWRTGGDTDSYNVYFGTDATPDAGEFKGSQTGTIYAPASLDDGTTYYWRVDAVNLQGETTGSVWQFTTRDAVSADVITIKKAEWRAGKMELKVEAKSSRNPDAVLTVEGFGQMQRKKSTYKLQTKPVPNPGTVTVISNFGGSATESVNLK